MPYKKHQIHIAKGYAVKGNTVELSDRARWGVTHQIRDEEGGGTFSAGLRGPIMMYLSDDEGCFWPVMSFLTDEEAEVLGAELLAAVKNNLKEAE